MVFRVEEGEEEEEEKEGRKAYLYIIGSGISWSEMWMRLNLSPVIVFLTDLFLSILQSVLPSLSSVGGIRERRTNKNKYAPKTNQFDNDKYKSQKEEEPWLRKFQA